VARVTCIAVIGLTPVVSGLRFICGLRQQRVFLCLVHVARLTCIALFYLSPVVSALCFVCGLCGLREKGVLILLRLQAHLYKSDEIAQPSSAILILIALIVHHNWRLSSATSSHLVLM
jgi:hypothetical protein